MADTYEICIDESGDFEKYNRDQHRETQKEPIKLIGGVLVPPGLKKEEELIKEELIPIREKYFPDGKKISDIHLSDENLSWENKQALRRDMLEVFRSKMSGAQVFFIYDLEELTEESSPPGAQLYRNMLTNLLKSIIHYHPKFDESDEFKVNIASRRFTYPVGYDKGLAGQGYLKIKDDKRKTEYTAIIEADLISIMHAVKNTLRFQSNRGATYEIRPYGQWDNPFMVMADTVCNTIYNIFKQITDPMQFDQGLGRTFKKEGIFFYCSSDYDFPIKQLETFHQGRVDRFLSEYLLSFENRSPKDTITDRSLLRPGVKKSSQKLSESEDHEKCETIVRLADHFLENRLFYRLDEVKDLIDLVKTKMTSVTDGPADSLWDPLAYLYHDVCLRYCNHSANTIQAKFHRAQGVKLFDRLPTKELAQIRAHHEVINRASVDDTNEFAFERAIVRIVPVKEREEKILEILGPTRNKILGKIYGSLAQNYAFMKKDGEAKAYFEKAAVHLGWDNFMQVSYRAHQDLDRKDQEYFNELAMKFKQESFNGFGPLISVCLENLKDSAFDLHLLLKGMLVFQMDFEEKKIESNRIYNGIKSYIGKTKENHPWELIFITLGRIFKETGDTDNAVQCWDRAIDFTSDMEKLTFRMIGYSARAWGALFLLEGNKKDKAIEIIRPIFEEFHKFKNTNNALGIFNPNRIPDEDGQVRSGWFDQIGNRFLNEFEAANPATLKSLSEEFTSRFTFNYW